MPSKRKISQLNNGWVEHHNALQTHDHCIFFADRLRLTGMKLPSTIIAIMRNIRYPATRNYFLACNDRDVRRITKLPTCRYHTYHP